MNLRGMSDSVTTVLGAPEPCASCGSTSQVGRGFCLHCLLQTGVEAPEDNGVDLAELLDQVAVRDADWRLGNYQILEEIGRGGMGVIYRARQRHSRRIVALKRVLSYHADSRDTLVRFRREAEAAASLDHPNILPIYEVSEGEDGLPYFSMKFAPGGSLLEAAPALREEPRRAVAVMAKVARAVQYAHMQGILHRDLKPGNILLDGRGEPLVSDFGLAKWLDTTSDLTRTLTIFGTPGYIAPEQAHGPARNLAPAADIYSLGAILFDLLTGRPPFLGEHALAVIHQAAEKPAPKLRSVARHIDRDLETICAKCLERDARARYHSASEFAEDLERWLEGRPIFARPVFPLIRLWRWAKRNPMLAGSGATAALLGAVGIIAALTTSRLNSIVRDADIARHSVVVMPFEDLEDLPAGSVAARATTEAFTRNLQSARGIYLRPTPATIPRDPWRSEDWNKIGEAAGARMIIFGSIRQRDGKQRVAIHLVDTPTGLIVSTRLENVESALEIGKLLPKQVSVALGTSAPSKLNPELITGTTDSSAQSYYERGKEFFLRHNLPDLDRAIDSLRTAVRVDSNYAQAYALLATACQLRSLIDPDGTWLNQADAAASKALSIAPMLAEGYDARAGNALYRGRVRESVDDFLTAYELEPANGRACARLAHAYHLLGRPDQALLWYEKASRRESQPVYADNIGDVWTDVGDYHKAEDAYNTAAIFRPDIPVSAIGLSRIELFRGEFGKARMRCHEACEKYKGNPQPLIIAAQIEFFSRDFAKAEKLYSELIKRDHAGAVDYHGSVRFLSALGFIHAKMGVADGQRLLHQALMLDRKELETAPGSAARLYSLAANYAAFGEEESSLAELENAIRAGWIDYRSVELDPRFDVVRVTPHFQQAIVNLQQTVREMAERTKQVSNE
jgi:tetratricopeptide (TPR) repeat protein/TolB-like protein/tRNA A-37 threonylcarbamoyl transferase component Bud32